MEQFQKQLKCARENQILGNYEESIAEYKQVLDFIRKHILNNYGCPWGTQADPKIKQKWKEVNDVVKSELSLADETNLLKLSFKDSFGQNKKNEPIFKRDSIPVEIVTPEQKFIFQDLNSKPFNPERFNGKMPFQHHQSDINEYFGNQISQDQFQNQDVFYVQRRNKSYIRPNNQPNNNQNSPSKIYNNQQSPYRQSPDIKKDPDVWDPPTPQQNNQLIRKNENAWAQKAAQKKNVKRGVSQKPNNAGQGAIDQARRYDKPWLNGLPQNVGGNNKGNDKQSSYLYSLYSDGIGPDSDLINMLERDVIEKNPQVNFDDISELEDAKKTLQEAVILPILMPDYFRGIRRPWKGVLMFGPPGTGKTMLAKAVAAQGQTTFFNITASSLSSKWKGESEKLVRILFEMARFYAPTTIFMDEIDAIGSSRGGQNEHEASRRVKSELLIQMDGVNVVSSASANEKLEEGQKLKTVMVLAASNRPFDLDEALRRRLEKRIYIPLPSTQGRRKLFEINLKGVKTAEDVNWDQLVKQTDGYSGSDIACVCREAALMSMRQKISDGTMDIDKIAAELNDNHVEMPITMQDFVQALKNVQKSVSQEHLDQYQEWMEEFGCI